MSKREKLTLKWTGKAARLPDVTFVAIDEAPGKDRTAHATVRVGAGGVQVIAVHEATAHDPVDLCLELWKTWMHGANDRDLGAKTMRGLCGEGDGYGTSDPYDAQHKSDMRMAEATDAMINSLSRIHVWAIYRACSLATVWKFPNAVLQDVVMEARSELEKKLRKNICTAVLF